MVEELRWLTARQAVRIADEVGTPCWAYSLDRLRAAAESALRFPCLADRGVTVRYAMKANPNAAILRVFLAAGLHFDCSSVYEVRRAAAAGVPLSRCSLSSQELKPGFAGLVQRGLHVNCCSMQQLLLFARECPGKDVGIRFNPGVGSGGTRQTNVGGPSSSFGVWHELAADCLKVASAAGCRIVRVHTHIGSGSDPAVWRRCTELSLGLVRRLPDVHTLNLGGGYKVGRMAAERSTDLEADCGVVRHALEDFARLTGRRLRLEVEPGTYLVAGAGSLVASVHDKVSTGADGHEFLKLDAGMTELLRTSLYGAQHPIVVVPRTLRAGTREYVVCGHCCESGDLLTPADGQPGLLQPRPLAVAEPGDVVVVEGAGAYGASMCAKHYNSFPEAPEVIVDSEGRLHLIRAREAAEDLWRREIPLPSL